MSDLLTVYVSIGNSDDKLSQKGWHEFWIALRSAVVQAAEEIHGEWLSIPVAPYQNACICFDIHVSNAARLKEELASIAHVFRQSAITWAEASTEFLLPR